MVSRIGGRFWERKAAVCRTASEKTGSIGSWICSSNSDPYTPQWPLYAGCVPSHKMVQNV